MTHKQVIVMRKDLKMRRGKEIAQGAHASLGALLSIGKFIQKGFGRRGKDFRIDLDTRSLPWLEDSFTKVCVTVNSEEEIRDLCKQAS